MLLHMYQFSVATAMDGHKFSGLKQHISVVSQFWGSEAGSLFHWAKVKGSAGLASFGGSRKESIPLPFPAFLSAFLGSWAPSSSRPGGRHLQSRLLCTCSLPPSLPSRFCPPIFSDSCRPLAGTLVIISHPRDNPG